MFFGKVKTKPRIRICDIFAALFIFMGFLFLLIIIHILTINTTGNTNDVMNTIFIILLRIFETLLIFSIVGLIIHFLRYMVWMITTPRWVKQKYDNRK